LPWANCGVQEKLSKLSIQAYSATVDDDDITWSDQRFHAHLKLTFFILGLRIRTESDACFAYLIWIEILPGDSAKLLENLSIELTGATNRAGKLRKLFHALRNLIQWLCVCGVDAALRPHIRRRLDAEDLSLLHFDADRRCVFRLDDDSNRAAECVVEDDLLALDRALPRVDLEGDLTRVRERLELVAE
jgi:hypothetical protein